MTADEFAVEVGKAAGEELDEALETIKHCLDQLSEEEVWWCPPPLSPDEYRMNSIGHLILHLHGNARQWLVAGLDGPAYTRDRRGEFVETRRFPKADLLILLGCVVRDAKERFEMQAAERLLEGRIPQKREVTGLGAIFHSVPHFRGHTQEIIHITRTLLGRGYEFKKPLTLLE